MTVVAICAATLRRPKGLAALLKSLRAQEVPEGVQIRTVIVDNDPAGSARTLVEEAAADWPHEDLRYRIEERRGIPFARTCGVRTARQFEWAAFIDDDEVAEPGWIRHMLEAARTYNADVVTGAVLPSYDVAPPDWIRRGVSSSARGMRQVLACTSLERVMPWSTPAG